MNKIRQGDTIANATTCHNTSHISSRARPARRRAEHHASVPSASSLIPSSLQTRARSPRAQFRHQAYHFRTTTRTPKRNNGSPPTTARQSLSHRPCSLLFSRTPKGRRPESSHRRSGPGAARAESPPLRARPPPRASSRPAGWRTTCCHNAHKSPRRAEW